MQTLVWLTIALPLAGAVILLLGGKATNAWGHLLACAAVLGAFACGAVLFTHLLGLPGGGDRAVHDVLFSWVPVGVFCAWTSVCNSTRCRCVSCC